MNAGLQAFLSGIVDYAGLFPPASLPLGEALANYVRYRGEPEAWMLGRFVCPAARLGELAGLLPPEEPESRPVPVVALGRGNDDRGKFLEGLSEDLAGVAAFLGEYGPRAKIEVFELKLPADVTATGDVGTVWQLLDEVNERFVGAGKASIFCFCEAAAGRSWKAVDSAVLAALSSRRGSVRMGFKLRCGGADPASVPSTERVAYVLRACLQNDIAFKATAGLHQPLRHLDPAIQTHAHGFVNVFAAGVLGAREDADLAAILEEEDPAQFRFDEDGLSWRDHRAGVKQIAAARKNRVLSFGSCSFDEPRDGLRALGWL